VVGILGVMEWTWGVPSWVAWPLVDFSDLRWIAYREWLDSKTSYSGGVLAAVAWVVGDGVGPVTGRGEQPVTGYLACAERGAARGAGADLVHQRQSAALNMVQFGEAYRAPRVSDREFALGVWKTLGWLLGEDEEAPLPLPVRNEDGSVPTVGEVYDRAVEFAVLMRRDLTPRARRALREDAESNVRFWRELADQVDDTKRHAGVV
jgi:hypothetical protein